MRHEAGQSWPFGAVDVKARQALICCARRSLSACIKELNDDGWLFPSIKCSMEKSCLVLSCLVLKGINLLFAL